MKKYLKMVREVDGPVLLHVITKKGHGFQPAAEDPVFFHTPPTFDTSEEGDAVVKGGASSKAYTNYARDAIADQMRHNDKVTVITAAMCQGNKLEPVREEFPDRFFDVGICESHAVAFAGGQAGPTHHGTFDYSYLRAFPNMVVMAPGDANDLGAMLDFSLSHDVACSIRYPKLVAEEISRKLQPVELGKSEVVREGSDGVIVCIGTPLKDCLDAAAQLATEGINLSVINARFVKPIDAEMVKLCLTEFDFVVTVEEAMLMGGFGSAFLEEANNQRLSTVNVHRIGVPDEFVQHAERHEVLAELKLDAAGVASVCRAAMAELAGAAKSNPVA